MGLNPYAEGELFAPEQALPCQLVPRSRITEGERAFYAELILTAVDDLRGGRRPSQGATKKKTIERARAWIASTSREGWKISFEYACEQAGIDPSGVRRGLGIEPEHGIDRGPWLAMWAAEDRAERAEEAKAA